MILIREKELKTSDFGRIFKETTSSTGATLLY